MYRQRPEIIRRNKWGDIRMTGNKWKSFWMGTLAAVFLAVVAGVIMSNSNLGVDEKFSSSSTRLD